MTRFRRHPRSTIEQDGRMYRRSLLYEVAWRDQLLQSVSGEVITWLSPVCAALNWLRHRGQTELLAWPADYESVAVHSGNTE